MSEETNIKIQNYLMMERKYAFESDNEWIRNNIKKANLIDEESGLELVQK